MLTHKGRRTVSSAGERRIRLLRIRALLAGGLVLGTGATSTLASWNDAEYANSTFTAAQFGIEGSLDGTDYSKHASTNAAALSFNPAVRGLFPGNTSYAAFAVRATSGSIAGQVQLTAGTPAGALIDLRYGVRTVSAMTQCNATGYVNGRTVIPDGSTLGTSSSILQALAADRTPVYYCFAITLPVDASNSMQTTTATQTWQLVATST
ncbi:SipW-dependent-type signal peptide-containing protein [Microbacterium sp. 22242]|uniref:SipW-dependent-type signal peptide-containing protein n=1 Tax=Microbacterium sp. 22242 TaxID=3453896 RepID=UPI003F83004B